MPGMQGNHQGKYSMIEGFPHWVIHLRCQASMNLFGYIMALAIGMGLSISNTKMCCTLQLVLARPS